MADDPIWPSVMTALEALINNSLANPQQNFWKVILPDPDPELSATIVAQRLCQNNTPLQNLCDCINNVDELGDYRDGFGEFVQQNLQCLINLATMAELPRENLSAMLACFHEHCINSALASESDDKEIVFSEVCLAFVMSGICNMQDLALDKSNHSDQLVNQQKGSFRKWYPAVSPSAPEAGIEEFSLTNFRPMPRPVDGNVQDVSSSPFWRSLMKELALQLAPGKRDSLDYAANKSLVKERLGSFRRVRTAKTRVVVFIQGISRDQLHFAHTILSSELPDLYGDVLFVVGFSEAFNGIYSSIIAARSALTNRIEMLINPKIAP